MLQRIRKSALLLQNENVRHICESCLSELNIRRRIPVYSTAFLPSPVLAGFFRPRIYLPIRMISDFSAEDMRFMFLHELQHYRSNDILISCLANAACILYWFNPLVWYMQKTLRRERELACDASVLELLPECDYSAYGFTLLQVTESLQKPSLFLTVPMGAAKKQLKQRILQIASYRKSTRRQRTLGAFICLLALTFTVGISPVFASDASEDRYSFEKAPETVAYLDLSREFEGYEGCFVLYDEGKDLWQIYNQEAALTRTSPYSTYKIYDALLGLESGIITPEDSRMAWDGQSFPIDAWEADQDLNSAIKNSVNWYFQRIDEALGASQVQDYLDEIGYGNQKMSRRLDLYWTDSSLKISPAEQVELLQKLYHNDFHFSAENVNAVKQSLFLSSSSRGRLFGKTGTGQIDQKEVSGWFVGCLENQGNVSYFATNIQADSDASGNRAKELTERILSQIYD